MAAINKPAQPLIAPTDVEEVEAIAGAAAADAIAADTTHAPLVNDLVPAANLPSYVDDVLEFATLDSFPAEGEAGKIYVALDTNNTYRWADTTYVQVGGSEIDLTPYALKTEVAAKADAADLESLAGVVAVKADASAVVALADTVAAKADASTVVALADTVATKADASVVAAKADSATVAALAEEVAAKANAAAIQEALAEMEDEIAAKAGSAAIEELEAALVTKANKPVNVIQFDIPDGWDGDFKDLLESQDTELIHALIINSFTDGERPTKSIAYFDQLGNYYEFWATSENSADVHIKPNVYGQSEFSDIPRTLSLLITSVSIQTDAETGDTWIIADEITESSYATYQDIEEAAAGLKILTLPQVHQSLSDEDMAIWNTTPHQNIAFIIKDNWTIQNFGSAQGEICYYCKEDSRNQLYYGAIGAAAYGVGVVAVISEAGLVLERNGVKIHDSAKQDALKPGINIKTINNQSIMGSGDLEIQAGMDEQAVAELIDNIAMNGDMDEIPNTGRILKGYETPMETFRALDAEVVERLIGESQDEGGIACIDTLGRRYRLEPTSENSADVSVLTPELGTCGFFVDYWFSVRIETDTEDPQVVTGEEEGTNPDAFDALENFGFPKAHNILADWAPKDLWDGSLQMLLEQQDAELVDKVIAAGMHEDAETGDYFCRPIHFVDALGNKYTVEPIEWTSANFYIEWNYEHGIDSIDTDQGISPVQKWQCQIESDAETGVPTQVVWTKDYETRYATIDEIGGSASVTPEAVAEAMSELEATDDDIHSLFDY